MHFNLFAYLCLPSLQMVVMMNPRITKYKLRQLYKSKMLYHQLVSSTQHSMVLLGEYISYMQLATAGLLLALLYSQVKPAHLDSLSSVLIPKVVAVQSSIVYQCYQWYSILLYSYWSFHLFKVLSKQLQVEISLCLLMP